MVDDVEPFTAIVSFIHAERDVLALTSATSALVGANDVDVMLMIKGKHHRKIRCTRSAIAVHEKNGGNGIFRLQNVGVKGQTIMRSDAERATGLCEIPLFIAFDLFTKRCERGHEGGGIHGGFSAFGLSAECAAEHERHDDKRGDQERCHDAEENI